MYIDVIPSTSGWTWFIAVCPVPSGVENGCVGKMKCPLSLRKNQIFLAILVFCFRNVRSETINVEGLGSFILRNWFVNVYCSWIRPLSSVGHQEAEHLFCKWPPKTQNRLVARHPHNNVTKQNIDDSERMKSQFPSPLYCRLSFRTPKGVQCVP